jgi:hypothetical protein
LLKEIRSKLYTLRFILSGIGILFSISLIKLVIEAKGFYWSIFFGIGESVLTEVGIALIILGGVTLTLEFVDITNFFIDKLTHILVNDGFIDKVDKDQLIRLKKHIEQKLYFKDQTVDPKSFLHFVQDEVTPLLESCYYNDYSNYIDCKVQDNYFKKIIHRRYEIINPNKEPEKMDISVNNEMYKIPGIDNNEIFKIMSLKVDKVDKTSNFILEYKDLENIDSTYNLNVTGSYSYTVEDKSVVEFTFQTITPLSDIQFINSIVKPCKTYSSTFILNADDTYSLTGNAFGFMEKKKLIKTKLSKGFALKFNNWALPGDGFIFTIIKNK